MYVTQDISINIGDMFTNLGFLFNQQKYMSKDFWGDHSLEDFNSHMQVLGERNQSGKEQSW